MDGYVIAIILRLGELTIKVVRTKCMQISLFVVYISNGIMLYILIRFCPSCKQTSMSENSLSDWQGVSCTFFLYCILAGVDRSSIFRDKSTLDVASQKSDSFF